MQSCAVIFLSAVSAQEGKTRRVHEDKHFGVWCVTVIPDALPHFAHMLLYHQGSFYFFISVIRRKTAYSDFKMACRKWSPQSQYIAHRYVIHLLCPGVLL